MRNSEGTIVSRQARLRAVIWNEYQVFVFVFVFICVFVFVFVSVNEYPCIFMYHQVSVYNVFVERGNVAVLQCGVPASVRDSVEVRKIPEEIAMRRIGRSECVFKYAEAGGGRVNVLSVCRSRIWF